MQPESGLLMSHSSRMLTLHLCQRHLQPVSPSIRLSFIESMSCCLFSFAPNTTTSQMVTLVSHHPACFPELKRKEKEKKSKLLKHKSFSPSFNFHDETHVKRFDYGEQGCDYQTLKVSPVPESFLLLQNTVECFHHPALSCWRVTGLRVQEERGAPSTAESSSVLSSLTTLLSCSFGKITVRSRVLPGHSSLDSPDSAVSFKTFWDLQHFRPRGSCPPAQS